MNCSGKKEAAPIAATIGSGMGSPTEDFTLRCADGPRRKYITRFARTQDEADAFVELFRFGFDERETDAVLVHGYTSLQFYLAVLELLHLNLATEENVYRAFRAAMPELFIVGGQDVRPTQ